MKLEGQINKLRELTKVLRKERYRKMEELYQKALVNKGRLNRGSVSDPLILSLIESSDGRINLLICPGCIFEPDSRSIANQSWQSKNGQMRPYNWEDKKVVEHQRKKKKQNTDS